MSGVCCVFLLYGPGTVMRNLLRNGACTPRGTSSQAISSTKQLGLEIRLAVSTTKGHVSSSVVPEQTRPYVRTTRPFTCIKLMRSITNGSCS